LNEKLKMKNEKFWILNEKLIMKNEK